MGSQGSNCGILFLVATPIGNLEDTTLRALRILGQVRLVAAEDTRHTRKLLTAHNIRAELISYRGQNHKKTAGYLIELLQAGEDVALVCDAGTPGISDPGQALVALAVGRGIRVVPVPGPSAAITALAASGLPTDRFLFLGFPPRKTGLLRKLAEELSSETGSLVIYESPKRLPNTLGVLAEVWGRRYAVLARELTKLHETFDRGDLVELAERYVGGTKGEATLVVAGATRKETTAKPALQALVDALRAGRALSAGEVARLLAPAFGLERRQVYRMAASLGVKPVTRVPGEEDNG